MIENNQADEKLLDTLNKKLIHKNRLKKLKNEQASTRHKMSADLDACTRTFIESLLGMCDPYLKNRFSSFKQMAVKKTGPTFMQRMEKDHGVRKVVDQVINKSMTITELKTTTQQVQGQAAKEWDDDLVSEAL